MNESDNLRNSLIRISIHVPRVCEKCGAPSPEYKGVGEYKCSECGFVMYDDFGIVRNYLEEHRGATQSEVSRATGVPMETIRQFLREERLEVAAGSGVMLSCELCRAPIRSGRYCEACAKKVAMQEAAAKAAQKKNSVSGFGLGKAGESGAKRFRR